MSSNPVFKLGRRHFLMGAGGLALAIPFLPSLEKEARAGNPTRPPSRYFCIGTSHGGGWDQNYYPQNPTWGSPVPYGLQGHTVRSANLAQAFNAGDADGMSGVSKIIRASAAAGFTGGKTGLISKLNLLQGLDVPWYMAHHQGGYLGNFAVNNQSGSAGADGYVVAQLGARPTIDQIMANSPNFYAAAPKAASIPIAGAFGGNQSMSWAFSGAQDPSSAVIPIDNSDSSLPLFDSIFTVNVGPPMKTRVSAIDRVLLNYNSVMTGNSRLSAADKLRLEQHIDNLNDLKKSITAVTTCATTPSAPADNSNYGFYNSSPNFKLWGQLYMDVIAAAFVCNATRVASMPFGDTSLLSPSWLAAPIGGLTGDWHGEAAHKWFNDDAQGYLVESYQGFFEQIFLYLAAKLDGTPDSDGNTVLDNSLLVWAQECCMTTHEQFGIQTATFGGASGNMNTGLYCDYRHQNFKPSEWAVGQNLPAGASAQFANYVTWPGLLWEQWLATQLQVMQVPASDWQLWKDSKNAVQQGYGIPYVQKSDGNNFAEHYLPNNSAGWQGGPVTMSMSSYYSNAAQPLPFLTG